MRFTPKTDAQIAAAGLWPVGEYDFEIKDAAEKQSQSGNDMIELHVTVFNAHGDRTTIFDYLVHTEKAAYKVKHFAEATGLDEQYTRGEIDANACLNRSGRCKLIIKKDTSGQYPDKNEIRDYVKAAGRVAAPARPKVPAPAMADSLEDEIPF